MIPNDTKYIQYHCLYYSAHNIITVSNSQGELSINIILFPSNYFVIFNNPRYDLNSKMYIFM